MKKICKYKVERPFHLLTGQVAKDLDVIGIPGWIDDAIDHIFVLLLIVLYIWRSMLIAYDYHFKESILAVEWKTRAMRHPASYYFWIIEHKDTFGNGKWTLGVLTLASIVIAVGIVCIDCFLNWNQLFISIVIFIVLE
ncbi:hypothetical protein RFI_23995, partial [Reticulomyxa filosa]